MHITDIFLKTPLSIDFYFIPNFFQNLSSLTWGVAYLQVWPIRRCLRYFELCVVTDNKKSCYKYQLRNL